MNDSNIVRLLRLSVPGLTVKNAAALVYITTRHFDNWESCHVGIPKSKLELFILKIKDLHVENESVIIYDKDKAPISAFAKDAFVKVVWRADVAIVIFMSIIKSTRRPYLHQTIFEIENNKKVFDTIRTWKDSSPVW
jgi:predicted transcriptional regulator